MFEENSIVLPVVEITMMYDRKMEIISHRIMVSEACTYLSQGWIMGNNSIIIIQV